MCRRVSLSGLIPDDISFPAPPASPTHWRGCPSRTRTLFPALDPPPPAASPPTPGYKKSLGARKGTDAYFRSAALQRRAPGLSKFLKLNPQ